MVPRDKFDLESVTRLREASDDEVIGVIPEILPWLADCNWPVFSVICSRLSILGDKLSADLKSVLSGDDQDENECPEITLPVIIPAINVKLFDTNQTPLNVCSAIVTVESANGNETIYGSAFNDCSTKFNISVGYNLIEHKLLIEKAGYVSQNFDSILPIATKCGYETLELPVNLVAD